MPISPFGNPFGQMQFADLDNDGDQDALTTNRFWNPYSQSFVGSSYVLINNGISGFNTVSVLSANGVVNHLLGDLDGDADLDIFMVKDSGQLNQVFLNNGNGTFIGAPEQPAGGPSNALDGELGDMDGDGDLDVVILQNWGYQQSYQLLLNNGTGTFEEASVHPALDNSANAYSMSLEDIDGDGDLDLLTHAYNLNTGQFQLLMTLNDGNSELTESLTHEFISPFGNTFSPIGYGDLSGITISSENNTVEEKEYEYEEGTFVVGDSSEIMVEYLFDGGGFCKGELGLFNLSGMEHIAPDSDEFLLEAIRRANSGSELGHVVIMDKKHAARFQGSLEWEEDFNRGAYVGKQSFVMHTGDRFALVLSQNISLKQLAKNPDLVSEFGKQAIFSIPEANQPEAGKRVPRQIVDLNGLASTGQGVYGMEDIHLNKGGADRDYNDMVFQIKGATGTIISAESEIHRKRDWLSNSLGQDLLDYSTRIFDTNVQGTGGKDSLTGGIGDDLIEGFKYRDVLVGGLGNDVLTGGNGKDTFVLSVNSGTDMITDYKDDYDVIGLSDGLTYKDLSFAGNDILLAGTSNVLATLPGFNTTTLVENDFIVV